MKPNAAANTSFSKLCSTSSFPLNKTLFGLCKTTKSPLAVTIIIKNNNIKKYFNFANYLNIVQ